MVGLSGNGVFVMHMIRSGAIEGYERAVQLQGGNPHPIMQRAGISSAQLRQPDALLSYEKVAELLDLTAISCQQTAFALLLAARQTPLVIGELAVSSGQQPTLQESLRFTNKHLYIHATGVHLELFPQGQYTECRLQFDFSNAYGLAQLIQLSVAQLFNAVSSMEAGGSRSVMMHFRQAPPLAEASVPQVFKNLLVFNSHFDGIKLPQSWMSRKPKLDDALMREHFQARMQLLENAYPNDLQAQVRYIISNLLASSECTVGRVSAALDLHPRVLQKRLQQQGVSFRQLLQVTRREIAQQLLQHGHISVTDLALNLGYAEVSVFSRHFKQWTGYSPRQWRQKVSVARDL